MACAYNSFLWAMALTCTLFGSEWLEMRVNMALILLVGWLLFGLGSYLLLHLKNRDIPLWFTLLNSAVCTGYTLLLLGPKRFSVVPAAILREGLHLRRAAFGQINAVLLGVLLAALLALCLLAGARRQKAKANMCKSGQKPCPKNAQTPKSPL